ncbi:serine/threonine-protein kinase [Streptomyces sp. NPDC051907]|uniref:serine/threonine-protein kinase n=1 Tax=Streptomyces sp. NPDC051907 TaxID=3155284 RepID=UPI003448E74F
MPGIPGLLVAGRYRLDESIGQGGMGRVWRAADRILDRPVAVKEMRMNGEDAEDSRVRRERVRREARATARIDHPNVVRVYDVVEESDRLWIVMELVDAPSLEQVLLREGPLSPREAARIGLGLIGALREVHAVGVLHRDIKPGNVLVGRTGRVVLTDFGIAAIQDATQLTVAGMLVGSPDYMAPERVGGRPQGPPSDLWSLGATLCAALAGHSPFARPTTLATLHAVLYEEPELPPSAGELTPVLAALLVKPPQERPTLDELEAALTPVALPPVPDPHPSEPPPPAGYVPTRRVDPARLQEPLPAEPEPERQPEPEPMPPEPEPERPPEPQPPEPEPRPEPAEPAPERAPEPVPPGPAPERPPEPPPAPAPEPAPQPADPPPAPEPAPRPEPPEPPPPPTNPTLGLKLAPPPPRPALVPTRAPVRDPAAGPSPRARARFAVLSILLAAATAAVLVLLTAKTPGGDDRPASASSTSVDPAASGQASDPAASDQATDPATDPASPSTPPPTVAGTSTPPPGHRNETGFAWTPPEGWTRSAKSPSNVHYHSPDGKTEIAASYALARGGDLLTQWQQFEQDSNDVPGYRKIRLERTEFRGRPAIVWEYVFTEDGAPWRARQLGFTVGGKSYQLNVWFDQASQDDALAAYDEVSDSFTPL